MVNGLDGYLLPPNPIAANSQGRAHFVAQDVGVPGNYCPAAVQHGLGLGAEVTLVDRSADNDAVRPFQAFIELVHVVLVDAAAALPDAVVAVDAEIEVFAFG